MASWRGNKTEFMFPQTSTLLWLRIQIRKLTINTEYQAATTQPPHQPLLCCGLKYKEVLWSGGFSSINSWHNSLNLTVCHYLIKIAWAAWDEISENLTINFQIRYVTNIIKTKIAAVLQHWPATHWWYSIVNPTLQY